VCCTFCDCRQLVVCKVFLGRFRGVRLRFLRLWFHGSGSLSDCWLAWFVLLACQQVNVTARALLCSSANWQDLFSFALFSRRTECLPAQGDHARGHDQITIRICDADLQYNCNSRPLVPPMWFSGVICVERPTDDRKVEPEKGKAAGLVMQPSGFQPLFTRPAEVCLPAFYRLACSSLQVQRLRRPCSATAVERTLRILPRIAKHILAGFRREAPLRFARPSAPRCASATDQSTR